MSLSSDTLLLFAALVPGLIFRFWIYHRSLINRPIFSGNPVYSGITVVFSASVVHLVTLMSTVAVVWIAMVVRSHAAVDASVQEHDWLVWLWENRNHPAHGFAVGIAYMVVATAMAFLLAYALRWLAKHSLALRNVLYGQYSDFMAPSSGEQVTTLFVLTKTSYQNRVVVYAGLPMEIGIGDGSKIDYVVLDVPAKFYLRLNAKAPVTSLTSMREVGESKVRRMYIEGKEIQNIHFERFDVANATPQT